MLQKSGQDWRGWRFIVLSGVLSVLIFLLFVAGSHSLKTSGFMGLYKFSSSWKIETVTLSLGNDEPSLAKSFFWDRLEKQARSYEQRSFFELSPYKILADFQELPFVGRASVRRQLPASLWIDLELIEPRFLIRSREAWLLADREGRFLAPIRALEASSWDLQIVLGLENRLMGDVENLNHYYKKESEWLAQLGRLAEKAQSRLGWPVNLWTLHDDPWTNQAYVSASWAALRVDLPLKMKEESWRSLQFILSDLKEQDFHSGHLMGRFGTRWYFKPALEEI